MDRRDLKTGLTAMQRTVGSTMSIGVQLVLNRTINNAGRVSLLMVSLETVQEELIRRGIAITKLVHSLN
jgi:alkylated DNA nucleotide flippase Atl1